MAQKILIIEDDKILGDILNKKLSTAGYDVTLAADGAVGLDAIRRVHPDLILLDILLPTMNGYEILEAKSTDNSIKEIPVMVISNSGQPVELGRTMTLGAKDYFIKAQFNPDEILEKVRALMPKPDATAATATSSSTTKRKILSVEDDEFLSAVLIKKFTTEGMSTYHATNAPDALTIAANEHPDIILLDLILPDTSGFDILKALKEKPETKDIPVIILSNLSQQDDMSTAHKLGAAKFIVKAMSTPDDIFNEVRTVLG